MIIMSNGKKEYQVIIVNPKRCLDCETCMEICALVHESEYIPLNRRIIGKRIRIEMEWAISCDLCEEMNDDFINFDMEKRPQCIEACPHNAIFISTVESYENESRDEAINRIFKNPS